MGETKNATVRTAGQACGWVITLSVAGRAIVGPLRGMPSEDRLITEPLVTVRTPAWDRLTWLLSTYADTVPTIATAVAAFPVLRRGTETRRAARPLAAIALETAVFMSAAGLVGRPRPDVPWLDKPAPTSSFPSGHTGACTALHHTVADAMDDGLLPGARLAPVVRWVLPSLVAASRVYRGMHHPSDVLAGLVLGAWSARATARMLPAATIDRP